MENVKWWYAIGRQQLGPVSEEELQSLFQSKKINGDTLVWKSGMANWQKASTLPELEGYLKSSRWGRPRQKKKVPSLEQNERDYSVASEYAGFWRRYFALCIDDLIESMIAFAGAFFLYQGGCLRDTSPEKTLIVYPMALLVVWLYNALMESSSLQATVGKLALGIKVTDVNGNRISFLRATGRCFGKVFLSSMFFSIGYLLALFTGRKQALHDLIAGTIVVKGR